MGKVARLGPGWLAVLGVQAYRTAFAQPEARIGRQPGTIGNGTGVWVLPNPSGLQARYQLDEMIKLFSELRQAAAATPRHQAAATTPRPDRPTKPARPGGGRPDPTG